MPPLIPRAPILAGEAHLLFGTTGCPIFRCEEGRSLCTDHLRGYPTQNTLGPDVPVGHTAVSIRGDDREIGSAVEDGSMALVCSRLLPKLSNLALESLVEAAEFFRLGKRHRCRAERAAWARPTSLASCRSRVRRAARTTSLALP